MLRCSRTLRKILPVNKKHLLIPVYNVTKAQTGTTEEGQSDRRLIAGNNGQMFELTGVEEPVRHSDSDGTNQATIYVQQENWKAAKSRLVSNNTTIIQICIFYKFDIT